ncbi:hypothetical protein FQN54_004923 [Arachnomyces sp. PD_36]|nr:hypothetical protein FQN54_004923 [Arachnomyces sp. PD_36]
MNTSEANPPQGPTETTNTYNVPNKPPTADNASAAKPRKVVGRRPITLSTAEEEEEDMRAELQYNRKTADFVDEFIVNKDEIKALVATHFGLPRPDLVRVSNFFDGPKILWIYGSFNLCIPVYIYGREGLPPSKIAFRVPLPHKIGEEAFPGNAEEKLRSEAATYAWISENCPTIPIPKLRGFGLPGGRSFFEPRSVSLWQRVKVYIWRIFRQLYERPTFCEYIPKERTTFLKHGYMLIDWVGNDSGGDDTVQMLSNTFAKPHTEEQTENLYRGLSKIMISLAKIPQPRIGSWTVDNDGRISLSNRPMFCHLNMLENWGIPTGIPRDTTYTSADSLYLDLLDGHDNRLRYQANSAFDSEDARAQAAHLVLMRALLHKFTDRSLRDGPFVMQLTDLHASNVFVDKNWNVKHVIDLEWVCSLPIERILPPHWLTGRGLDQLNGPDSEPFEACYNQFTDIFEQEETNMPLYHGRSTFSRQANMKTALHDGRYWYSHALETPKGLYNLCGQHIKPFYEKVPKATLNEAVSPFWTPGMSLFVESKVEELALYREEVREIFNDGRSGRFYP